MRSTFKILFYINRQKVKADGNTAILCRITIDGKSAAITTDEQCNPSEWNVKLGLTTDKKTNQRIYEFKKLVEKTYREKDGMINVELIKNRFTKHYFIGDKRVASKLGVGKFSNVYGISGKNVTAGQKDNAARMMQIEKQREEYYKSRETPPGIPTMKGATADPDNTHRGYNNIIGDLGDHSVPEGWIRHPKCNTTPGHLRGHPSNGRNRKIRIMPNRAMVISQRIPPTPRKSSSIIVTTSVAPLISPTPRPTSPSSMLTCLMENCLWMNTAVVRNAV